MYFLLFQKYNIKKKIFALMPEKLGYLDVVEYGLYTLSVIARLVSASSEILKSNKFSRSWDRNGSPVV